MAPSEPPGARSALSSESHALDLDTIAAIATPTGRGGVSIIRVSGPEAWPIAERLTQKALLPRQPVFCGFRGADGEVIDEGLTLMFRGPASFTGEDIAEFHGHGGVIITNLLLETCLTFGARLARPGEFSERAFLNNKLDLAQAEGLADLIDAPTEQAARQASASLRGAFSAAVNTLNQQLIDLRVFVEAAIDFPEEEVDFLSEGKVTSSLKTALSQLRGLLQQAKQGAVMSRGAQIVLTGAPNAGKSSLMNQLAQDTVAIVTDIPGTTRDVIRQSIEIEGVAIQLSDTAGIRDATNAIEQEGIHRAYAEIEHADIVIDVIDDTAGWAPTDTRSRHQSVIRVINKIDLTSRTSGIVSEQAGESERLSTRQPTTVAVSATTGDGIDTLKHSILTHLGLGNSAAATPFSARERHVTCLKQAASALEHSIERFEDHRAGELLAEDLRMVHDHLGDITGEFGSDALLGEIFSSFCIGK